MVNEAFDKVIPTSQQQINPGHNILMEYKKSDPNDIIRAHILTQEEKEKRIKINQSKDILIKPLSS